MDVLLIGDVHLTDVSRHPSGRTSDYTEQILAKLQFSVDKANELQLPIVQAGDLFHLKSSTKNSHALVQRVHEVFKSADNGVWIVPGNHDLQNDRLESLDKQPLGALVRMSNVHLLLGTDRELPGIAGIPYLTEFDGGDWQTAIKPWLEKCKDAELVVTHAPIFPPGQAPGVYYSIKPHEWSLQLEGFGIQNTFYGHIHDAHSSYEAYGHTFCNQGALSRGSLHESSITRKPAITAWINQKFHRIEVPHKEAPEVFLLEQAHTKAIDKTNSQAFAEAVGSSVLETLTIEEVLSTLKNQVSDQRVMSIIEQCLEKIAND